jgi:hypothetical protein
VYGNIFSNAQVKAIIAKENEVLIHLNPSTIKKLKALERGWKSKLSAKVEEWVKQGI